MRSPRLGSLLLTIAFVAVPSAAEAGVLTDGLPPVPERTTLALQEAEPFLEAPADPAPSLPVSPNTALIDAIGSLSSEMGVRRDATSAVVKATLSPEIAGRLALALNDMLGCQRATKRHMAAIEPSVLKTAAKEHGNGGGLNPADFTDIRQCAGALWKSTNALQRALSAAILSGGPDLDVWPVIRYARGTANNTYTSDYALLIDAGGNDTYVNNAGANLIDVNWGPSGQPGLKGVGPAVGCARAIAGLTNRDCIPSVGVLLDQAGNDKYGMKQTPTLDADGVGDANCTNDRVVRRMVTNGSGFLGVGIAVDRSGNDSYSGKTVANGAGHVFGVGVLHDYAGDDAYLEVRNSTGFGLVGGLGVMRDHAGNDTRDFSMPGQKTPGAENQTPGAGGVIDDEDACDNQPRYDVGGGNVGATGVSVDAGNDSYTGGFAPVFIAPAGAATGGGASQGYANNGGTGALLDRAGADVYATMTLAPNTTANDGTWVRTPHANSRANGVTLAPAIDPATQQGGETGTGGVFRDT